jgi:phosphomevalonate kinase
MQIIGLAGKKRAGKDTIYSIASDILGGRVGRVGFADAVKHEVSEATGFRMDFIEEHKKDFRSLLQVWGTEFRRNLCGNEYWIEKMADVLKASKDHYDYIFITDVRFDNECEFIKNQGGQVVRVERRLESYKDLSEIEAFDSHSSENSFNDYSHYDYVLNNDGTERELNDSVVLMLETLNISKNAA